MLLLRSDEKLVAVVRRHWWTLLTPSVSFFILLLIPAGVAIFSPSFLLEFVSPETPLFKFGASIYFLFLLIFGLLLWMDYYLDVWIVTTRRIVDIDQKALFHRVVSEIPLSRIQNVTLDIEGVVETFLKFGTITVETAGESGNFAAENVPRPYEVKDAILEQVHKLMERGDPIVTVRD